ncbi:MAG: hypothetical protein OEW19_15315 [Acidobacteriota bacterium]|nr:hypothetical protein [Acidobacteriota bacterium]
MTRVLGHLGLGVVVSTLALALVARDQAMRASTAGGRRAGGAEGARRTA